MGTAIELAFEQRIRLHNHLSESTEHTVANFFEIPGEAEVYRKILDILHKNDVRY